VRSATVASVSLALLLALLTPASAPGGVPQVAPPTPSESAAPAMAVVGSPLNVQRIDLSRASRCPDGSTLWRTVRHGRPDRRTSWSFVSCATSEIVAPRIDP